MPVNYRRRREKNKAARQHQLEHGAHSHFVEAIVAGDIDTMHRILWPGTEGIGGHAESDHGQEQEGESKAQAAALQQRKELIEWNGKGAVTGLRPPLLAVMGANQGEALTYLLENGFSSVVNKMWYCAGNNHALYLAVKHHRMDMVSILLDHGAVPIPPPSSHVLSRANVLHLLGERGICEDLVRQIMASAPVEHWDVPNSRGRTPLMKAAAAGRDRMVQLMLDAGARTHWPMDDNAGCRLAKAWQGVLVSAVNNGRASTLRLLVAQPGRAKSLLPLLTPHYPAACPLHCRHEMLQLLLVELGVPVDRGTVRIGARGEVEYTGSPALRAAVTWQDMVSVWDLLQAGAAASLVLKGTTVTLVELAIRCSWAMADVWRLLVMGCPLPATWAAQTAYGASLYRTMDSEEAAVRYAQLLSVLEEEGHVVAKCSAAQLLAVTILPQLALALPQDEQQQQQQQQQHGVPLPRACALAALPLDVMMTKVVPKCGFHVADPLLTRHGRARYHRWTDDQKEGNAPAGVAVPLSPPVDPTPLRMLHKLVWNKA